MSLLSAILPSDIEGVKWAKLQRLFRQMADNAGISYALGFPLTDIHPSDTEGVKWEKLGAWAKLIADNISGGGGVTSVNGQTGVVSLDAADVGAAPAGVGDVITKDVTAVAVSLVSGVAKTIAYLDLPAGSWLVSGPFVEFFQDGGNPLTNNLYTSISLVNNAHGAPVINYQGFQTAFGLNDNVLVQGEVGFTFAVPTRVYLVASADFAANGVSVVAQIMAKKVASITVQ